MAFTLPKIPTINELASKLPSYSSTPTTTTSTNSQSFIGPVQSATPTTVKTTTVTPSSPAATSTTYKPPAVTQTPAAQQYINQQVSAPSAPDKYADLLKSAPLEVNSSVPKSAYLEFLRKQFDPEALKTAQTNINDINKRTSDELLRARHDEDVIRKNQIGQLESGVNYGLNENARLSNRSLADLAIAKGVAVEVYNQMLDAGKTVYEAEEAARKAAQEQLNANRGFQLDIMKQKETEANNAATMAFNEKKFEEDKRQFNAQYALDAARVAIAQAEANGKVLDKAEEQAKEESDAASKVSLINNLLKDNSYTKITGIGQNPFNIFGLANGELINKFKELKGALALDKRQLLKGSGAISDFESKTLDQAASALGRNLNNEAMGRELKQVRGAILTSHGLTATVKITNPQTGQSEVGEADSAGIAKAVNSGYYVEYQ